MKQEDGEKIFLAVLESAQSDLRALHKKYFEDIVFLGEIDEVQYRKEVDEIYQKHHLVVHREGKV